jgi:hypothetical protein
MVTWATFPDWGGVSDLQAGFMGLFGSRSPEQTAELDDLYKDSVVPGSHHDWIVSHEVIKTNPEKKPNYFDIGYHKAKMGQGEGVINWYKKNVVPINDQLMADGTIAGYGMYTMELHGSTEYTHVTWATMTDTAEIDAVQAAFDAALSPEVYAEVIGMVEMDAHRDQLLLIVHLGGQPAEE